jgi:hypothetical protein
LFTTIPDPDPHPGSWFTTILDSPAAPSESVLPAPPLTSELRRALAALPAMLHVARDRALFLVRQAARSAALIIAAVPSERPASAV